MSMKPQSSLFKEIQNILVQARAKAVSAVNTAMVEAYWLMGKRIVEEEQKGEQRASYGEGIITQLSKSLVAEFGKGFSVANLKNFRKFYQTFPDFGKGYALRSEFYFEKSYTLCSLLSEKALLSDAKLSPSVRVLELDGIAAVSPIMPSLAFVPSLAIPSFSAVIPAKAGIQNNKGLVSDVSEGLQ